MNWKQAGGFYALALGFAWFLALVFWLSGAGLASPAGLGLRALAMFAPLVAALLARRWMYAETVPGLFGLGLSLGRWHLAGWLAPIGFALLAFGFALLWPGVYFTTELSGFVERMGGLSGESSDAAALQNQLAQNPPPLPYLAMAILGALVAGVVPNALFAFGEEAGWRGYLQRQLAPLGFWRASWLIGALWGFWHAPWILLGHNYPEHPFAGIGLMVLWCMLLSPLLGYLSIRSRSVVPATLFHGVTNASPSIALLHVAGGNDLLVGLTGLAGIAAAALMTGVLFLLLRSGVLDLPRNRFHAPRPYRPNAGGVIFNRRGEALAGERLNMPGAFQYPQGGVDEGEDPLTAARREVFEELGLDLGDAKPAGEVSDWLLYDFPEDLGGPLPQRYSGQKQKWYFFFWDGDLSELDLDAHEREFSRAVWMRPEELARQIVWFKRPIYRRLAREARRIIAEYPRERS